MPSIDVHTEDPEMFAAIGFSRATGRASPAEIVGFNGAKISPMKFTARRSPNDFDAEFMTETARVAEKRLLARERVDIRAADTAAPHAYQCLTQRRHRWSGFNPGERAGLIERE